MKTNIYIDGTDARAAFGVWVVRGGGPAGPGGPRRGWGGVRAPAGMGAFVGCMLLRPYTDTLKLAEDCTKNRFGARNVPRIAPKTVLKPETCRGLHQKPF